MTVLSMSTVTHALTDGYRLEMSATDYDLSRHGQDYYKARVSYALVQPSGAVLFAGNDFFPSPLHSALGKESACGLIGFLTAQPGGVDEDFFAAYTANQRAFAEGDAERYSYEWEQVLCPTEDK